MGRGADDSTYELFSSEDDTTSQPLLPSGSSSAPQRRLNDVSFKARLNRLGYLSSSHRNVRLSGVLQSIALVCLGFFAAAVVFFFVDYRPSNFRPLEMDEMSPSVELPVVGPPTLSFRENLLNDTQYITSWADSGWTNDVMTQMNLIYLGTITDRVPIIPPFHPSHVGHDAGYLDFSVAFDLPRLMSSLNRPILEWKQVKAPESDVVDEVGCWTTWSPMNGDGTSRPRSHDMIDKLKLDVAYTNVPNRVKLRKDTPHDPHVALWGLATLTFPDEYDEVIQNRPHSWPGKNHDNPPDEQLTCFDLVYYVGADTSFEMEHDYSPSWRYVGKYVRWNPDLKDLAFQMMHRAFGLPANAPVPPYIGMHIRRQDFKGWCGDVPVEECFAPLSAYVRRVKEIREALVAEPHPILVQFSETHSVPISEIDIPVVVTSDEPDPDWWKEIRALGWTWVDHTEEGENTEDLYGKWYPALLDAVFQSSGIGFVGTGRSTMSLLARRRVEDWDDGIGVMVKWGFKDADAH